MSEGKKRFENKPETSAGLALPPHTKFGTRSNQHHCSNRLNISSFSSHGNSICIPLQEMLKSRVSSHERIDILRCLLNFFDKLAIGHLPLGSNGELQIVILGRHIRDAESVCHNLDSVWSEWSHVDASQENAVPHPSRTLQSRVN